MADRQRVRVGRQVTYRPTDAEASTGNGSAGDAWHATISAVNADGTVSLHVLESDGGLVALTAITRGQAKGTFDVLTAA